MSSLIAAEQAVPTREEFVKRAQALADRFHDRAAGAEEARHLPEESISEMVAAGLPRILVPRRFGGYELGVVAWHDVVREIARGDASHGWCASLMIHHAHYVSLFPEEGQQAVWAEGPDTVVSASVVPTSKVTVVDGGYRISGKAPFTSGVSGASWVIIGGLVHDGDAPPEWTWFLVAPDQYEVEDTWFTSGMRGTGSNTVTTDNILVPESHALRQAAIKEATAPGCALHSAAFYHAPWSTYAPLTFVTPMLGAALGAYERFTEWTIGRPTQTGQSIADIAHVQVKLGRSAAALDCAGTLLRRAAEAVDSGASDDALRARTVRDCSFAAELITQSIDQIMALSGSAGFSLSNPIQRAWRDIHFATTHRALNPELNFAYYGQHELKVAPEPLQY